MHFSPTDTGQNPSQVSTRFATSDPTKLDSSAWASFVYGSESAVEDEHECSTVCLLARDKCQFYHVEGTTCYLGNVAHVAGAVLATPTATDDFRLQVSPLNMWQGDQKDTAYETFV